MLSLAVTEILMFNKFFATWILSSYSMVLTIIIANKYYSSSVTLVFMLICMRWHGYITLLILWWNLYAGCRDSLHIDVWHIFISCGSHGMCNFFTWAVGIRFGTKYSENNDSKCAFIGWNGILGLLGSPSSLACFAVACWIIIFNCPLYSSRLLSLFKKTPAYSRFPNQWTVRFNLKCTVLCNEK